jgi:hypothetical protein
MQERRVYLLLCLHRLQVGFHDLVDPAYFAKLGKFIYFRSPTSPMQTRKPIKPPAELFKYLGIPYGVEVARMYSRADGFNGRKHPTATPKYLGFSLKDFVSCFRHG